MSYENALTFLTCLEEDRLLAARCRATDLAGRIAIARDMGYAFTETDFLKTISLWDYSGAWSRWLPKDYFAGKNLDLPALSEPYSLPQEKIEAYQRDGHVLVREVVSTAEMEAFRPVIRDAVKRIFVDTRPFEERRKVGDTLFLRALNTWLQDDNMRRFVLAPRFGRMAAELMGVEATRIYFDQALFKEAGGKPTPWHQDQLYFPVDLPKVVSMWLPLVDIPAGMAFAAGSQAAGYLGDLPIGEAGAAESLDRLIAERGYPIIPVGPMKAGDATFHDGWVLHMAPKNEQPFMREVLTVVFFADGSRLIEPENVYQERALEHLFLGQNSGDVAGGPYHPLAYTSI